MKKILLIVLLSANLFCQAQDIGTAWANPIGGTGAEIVRSTVVDQSGNVYIAGSFGTTVNFNPKGTAVNLTSEGSTDAFFAKYTSEGELIWANRLGSTGLDEIYSIAVDVSGNVYITGYYSGTVDFDPGSGISNFTSFGGADIFWGKYSSSGTMTSVAMPDNGTGEDVGLGIKVDATGNIYVTGYFSSSIDFDATTAVSSRTAIGGKDIFLSKYSSTNGLLWANTFGSPLDDHGKCIVLDADGVIVAGTYSGSMDVNPAGVTTLSNLGDTDGYYAKYSQSNGTLQWAGTIRSTGEDAVSSIEVAGNHLYLGGIFSATATFTTGASGTATRTSNGNTDAFIAKYYLNAPPELEWLNAFGGANFDRLYGIAVAVFDEGVAGETVGDVYGTGYFSGSVDFDASSGTAIIVGGLADAYICSYGYNGNYRLAKRLVSTSATGTIGVTITADAGFTHNVYWGGAFANTASFDFTTSAYDRTSLGGFDAFLSKHIPLDDEPVSQPTNLTFTNNTSTSFSYSFTAAADTPDGYIVLRSSGTEVTGVPVDGVVYTTGGSLGNAVIRAIGPDLTYTANSLTPSTTYHTALFSYNGSGSAINYKVPGVKGSTSTSSETSTPTISSFAPASGAIGTSVTITGTNFSTTPANNIVKFNNVSATVTASTATTITTTIPSGTTTGKITVAIGTQTATSTTDFTIVVMAPEPLPPSNLKFFNVKSTSYNFSFDAPTPAPDGYIHILKEGSPPTEIPVDGTVYTFVKSFGTSKVMLVGPGTSFTQSNISKSTTYYMAVYSYNGSGASINYNTVTAATANTTTPAADPTIQITNESLPDVYTKGNSMTASVTVNDATQVSKVVLKIRGISQPVAEEKTLDVTGSAAKFEKVITAADLTDPIGVIYYFEVTDNAQGKITSSVGKAYVKITDQPIPELSFGTQVSNYQIISIPLQLTNKNVSAVFASLMPYDKTKWRLFDYAGDNREYSGFNTIEQGKGYWLIVKANTAINPGEGKAAAVHEDAPFQIALVAGWNLIGNPYNFRVSWADVIAYNGNPAGVSDKLKIFSGGTLSEGTILEKYRGAFVFASSATTLKIPVTRNTSLGGRIDLKQELTNPLDQDNWELSLTMKQGDLSNELSGIGMHPEATLQGKDKFDEVSVPLPQGLGFFELASSHPELRVNFNKEVVPTQKQFTWHFSVKNESMESIDLNWRNEFFGKNEKKLVLIDLTTLETIDMRLQNHFKISAETKEIKIIFGEDNYVKEEKENHLPFIGTPYPIPARSFVTLPFRIAKGAEETHVFINVFDAHGKQVAVLENGKFAPGTYETKWQTNEQHGLFLIKTQLGNKSQSTKVIIE